MQWKHLYYYVHKCPNCGSFHTGRYVREPIGEENTDYVMREALRHGELIRFTDGIPDNNAYCEDCGHEWQEEIPPRWFTAERIQMEKNRRGTIAKYADYVEAHPKKKKNFIRKIFDYKIF